MNKKIKKEQILSIRIPTEQKDELNDAAKVLNQSRSQFARKAILMYLQNTKKNVIIKENKKMFL